MKKELSKWTMLTLGVVYPLFVIGFELYTGMCAETFFDPLPTAFHLFLVGLVPCTNFLIWRILFTGHKKHIKQIHFLATVSIGVALYYTIIFLPLLPVSIIGIAFFGLGFLPMAPIISLISGRKLYLQLKQTYPLATTKRWPLLKGVSFAFLALLLLDIPTTATQIGINLATSNTKDDHARGIQLLRLIGDEDLLLRMSYGGSRKATGILSFLIIYTSETNYISSSKAREVFYKVTGTPFNSYAAPPNTRSWARFDSEQGGTEVGGIIKDLNLISSQLDGSVMSDDGLAYLEWVLEFKNTSPREREARLQLSLPPNSVVSRATLWVNGEEREAAFAGESHVRQAYESVVRTLRDPLLVTQVGPDRILAQAFPIAANGGTIKFKIGITAPLDLNSGETASLTLPAIVAKNFGIPTEFAHAVWFESEYPIHSEIPTVKNTSIKDGHFRSSGSISNTELSTSRKEFTLQRDTSITQRISALNSDEVVIQDIVHAAPPLTDALIILLDGSVRVKAHIEEIGASLKTIPLGQKVGFFIASENPATVEIAEWSKKQEDKILAMLNQQSFEGGAR